MNKYLLIKMQLSSYNNCANTRQLSNNIALRFNPKLFLNFLNAFRGRLLI